MIQDDLSQKLEQYKQSLDSFVERLREDRYVLACVLVGSLNIDTIWHKDSIGLWVIEADGVSKRLRFDGEDERVLRTFAENGVNLHVEVIPRSRFRRMIEGNSRTTFSCNFFAARELVYCEDPSIAKWFDQANTVATTDQAKELLAITSWVVHAHRSAERTLNINQDIQSCNSGGHLGRP